MYSVHSLATRSKQIAHFAVRNRDHGASTVIDVQTAGISQQSVWCVSFWFCQNLYTFLFWLQICGKDEQDADTFFAFKSNKQFPRCTQTLLHFPAAGPGDFEILAWPRVDSGKILFCHTRRAVSNFVCCPSGKRPNIVPCIAYEDITADHFLSRFLFRFYAVNNKWALLLGALHVDRVLWVTLMLKSHQTNSCASVWVEFPISIAQSWDSDKNQKIGSMCMQWPVITNPTWRWSSKLGSAASATLISGLVARRASYRQGIFLLLPMPVLWLGIFQIFSAAYW